MEVAKMLLGEVFESFVKESPVCVMVRGTLEHALPARFVDELFEETAESQYTHELLFSQVVDLLGSVVGQVHRSVNAAYQRRRDEFSVSRRSVYGKINHVEPRVSRELVRRTAQRLTPVIDELKGDRPGLLPGYRVKILDGNHLPASEHRLKELRTLAAGPLPGHALVVLDPQRMQVCDVFPCEDGHAQERSLLLDLVEQLEPGEVWVADRNFCTPLFLWELNLNRAFFIVRQHATNVPCETTGPRRRVGRVETGTVYEQSVRTSDGCGNWLALRRITIRLDQPTTDGDTEIHLLTNLPPAVKATRIAVTYKNRWTIEGVFFELATALKSEIRSLGYPPAALFAFCLALVAYNILSVVKAALRSVHGTTKIDQEVSTYYLAEEIGAVARGMMIAIPSTHWTKTFGDCNAKEMARLLKALAKKVRLHHFQKHPRGPKKPPPKRVFHKRTPHVSTARILALRKAE
jgi:IS4 transposase